MKTIEKPILIKPITFLKESKIKGYICSDEGDVYSAKIKGGQGKLDYNNLHKLRYKTDKDGYYEICLSYIEDDKQVRKHLKVHRFIYETFYGPVDDGYTVDHINNKKRDNCPDNLQQLSLLENSTKRDTRHHFGNQVIYKVQDYNNGTTFLATAREVSDIYNISREKVRSISNRIDNKSYGKVLKNGINIKVESVEDIQTIDNC